MIRADAHVLVVACGSAKAEHPRPAAELYTGSLFRAAAAAAIADGRPWLILSAEHGLVTPDQPLAPYQRTLTDTSADIDRLAGLVAAQRPLLTRLGPGTEWAGVEAWTPARYTAALRGAGVPVIATPLAGLGIGEQIGWLTRHARSATAYHQATGIRPGPRAAARWLARDTGLVYAGSLPEHHGQPVVDAIETDWRDDGSLLGAPRYTVVLANGVALDHVHAASLTPAAAHPSAGRRMARAPAPAALPAAGAPTTHAHRKETPRCST